MLRADNHGESIFTGIYRVVITSTDREDSPRLLLILETVLKGFSWSLLSPKLVQYYGDLL